MSNQYYPPEKNVINPDMTFYFLNPARNEYKEFFGMWFNYMTLIVVL